MMIDCQPLAQCSGGRDAQLSSTNDMEHEEQVSAAIGQPCCSRPIRSVLAAHQRELILRPSRSQPDVSIDCPSSVLDPSRRPTFVLLETVAYKAGATSRSIDEKSTAFFRTVRKSQNAKRAKPKFVF